MSQLLEKENRLSWNQILIYHFYMGVFITLFYVWGSPKIIELGYPSFAVLLIAEIVILTPIALFHFYQVSRKIPWKEIILFKEKMSTLKFMLWTIGGIIAALAIYIPFYPVGVYFRETIFSWLPEWYFNVAYGTDDVQLVAQIFLIGALIDGFVGPIIEEFFFRGYLLPRMSHLGNWAPIVNGTFFGLYHFWQPHNLLGIIGVGIVLSYVVWKKRNVYIGIAIHCTLNVLGALGGYHAALEGVLVGR